MRKVIAGIVLASLLLGYAPEQASSDERYTVFLPFVSVGERCAVPGWSEIMGNWGVIVPEEIKSFFSNPSFEIDTAGWTTLGTNTIAQSTAQSKFGYNSLLCTYQDDLGVAQATGINVDGAGVHYATAWVYVPSNWDGGNVRLAFANFAGSSGEVVDEQWTAGTDATGVWKRIQTHATIAGGDLVGAVRVLLSGAPTAGRTIYVDAFQLEANDGATTYADGDQPGCAWNGAPHASTSTRSAQSRAGGAIEDLKDDYGFGVRTEVGTGASPIIMPIHGYSQLPGGKVSNIKDAPRPFTLTGVLKGAGADCDLREARQNLRSILRHDAVPKTKDGHQPVLIRYTNPGGVTKEIAAHYEAGLGASIAPLNRIHEIIPLRFLAEDPAWKAIGETAQILDSNDSAEFRLIAARLRSSGQWDELGPPAAPGIAVYTDIRALAEDDIYIYAGGDFQNFNNIANADYIVRMEKATGTWSALATGLSATVRALAVGADGTLYVGGDFLDAGGDGDADYVCQWNGTNFSALTAAPPLGDVVWALAFMQDGTLCIGGKFLNAGGDGDADYVCQWDGTNFSALTATPPLNSFVYSLVTGIDNTLYIGGIFVNAGGDADADNVCQWDGTSFSALTSIPLNNAVYALAVGSDGVLYLGGDFLNAGDDASADYICQWNGTSFSALGSGVNSTVYELQISQNGLLYAGGSFTEAGGLTLADRAAIWNGASWFHLDIDLPGAATAWAILLSTVDPVVESNYDVYVGFLTTGTGYFAGTTTATNNGNMQAFPKITVERSGGTTAILQQIRNETTGAMLLFDYTLLDGETLTIDLTSKRKNVTSSMFGARNDAILKNSDVNAFFLQPGANRITCFVSVVGAPTVTAAMIWRDSWDGND